MTKASCSECPSSFELIPPADPEYNTPRQKPESDDYIKRIYECDEEHHRNTIYWEKEEAIFVSGRSSDTNKGELEARSEFRSTRYE
jgi:hypothetical protein